MEIQFYINLSLIGLTVIYGLVHFKKLTSPFKILVFLLIFNFCSDSTGRILYYSGFQNTYSVYHLNALVYILLNALIYLRLHLFEKSLKRVIVYISVGCGLLAFLNLLIYQDLNKFPTLSIAAHSFQSITLSLLAFREILKIPTRTPLSGQAVFWLNAGMLFFYSVNFTHFAFFSQFNALTWGLYLNWIGNLVLNVSFLVSLHLNQKNTIGN